MKHIIIKQKYYTYILIAVLYGVLLFPYICSVLNTIPSADDFSLANGIRKWTRITDNYAVALVKFATSQWLNWGGSWIGMIFPCGFNPLGISDNPFLLLQIEMAISFLFFAGSYMALNSFGLKYLLNIQSRDKRLLFTWISLCVMLNTEIYSEIFYWYTGANYIWMIGSELIAIALMIKYFNGRMNRFSTVIFALAGIYACNGLQCIVPVTVLYLVLMYFNPRQYKMDKIKDYIIFVLFLLSAVSAICAPGNFFRHSMIDNSGLHPIVAIKYTLENIILISVDLLCNPIVFLFLLASFVMGMFVFNRAYRNKFLIAVALLLATFGMMFPVAVGYSSATMPNRIVFVYNVHILLCLSISIFLFGDYVASKALVRSSFHLSVNTCIGIVVLSYVVLGGWIKDSPYYVILSNIEKDKKIYEQSIDILEEIKYSGNDNIIVYTGSIPDSPVLKRLIISYDSGEWFNSAIAEYYGKESVVQGE